MRRTSKFFWATSLLGFASSLPKEAVTRDSTLAYYDSETGFTFSEYKAAYSLSAYIVYRVAVPSDTPSNTPYDAVLQIVAPTEVGWAGLAWGGTMPKNPLTVGWANGQKPIVSSRYAASHSMPAVYTGATYRQLTTGNRVNGSHWQLTVQCTDCTSFTGANGAVWLDPSGSNRFAFAYGATQPSSPTSNSSSLGIHDVVAYWDHDFFSGQNPDFANLVVKNGGMA